MAFLAAAGRIATTVAAMAATRLELAAVEVREGVRRLLGHLVLTVIAACLAGGAILLTVLFVILLFWDTYRLQAVAGMAALLGLASVLLIARVRAGLKSGPTLLSATLAELRADVESARHAARHPHEKDLHG